MNNGKIPSVIRWTRSDYAKLSYAVRQFNKKVSELEKLEGNVAPEEFDYREVRDSIYSRKELNRVIKSLKRINRESQQKIRTLDSGKQITQWELSELKKAQKRAVGRTTDKARAIVESDINVMGDREFKQLVRTKESIEDLFNRVGSDFKTTKKRTLIWGKTDYELWRADIFRSNFMNALEYMSNYNNYDILYQKLNSIKNPIQFYNYINQSDTLKDIFLYYRDENTANTYGGFKSNQNAFNKALDDLNLIDINEIDTE